MFHVMIQTTDRLQWSFKKDEIGDETQWRRGEYGEGDLAINLVEPVEEMYWIDWGSLGSASEEGSNGPPPAPPPICLRSCSTNSGLVACICWASCCPLEGNKELINYNYGQKHISTYTWRSDSSPPPPWPEPEIIWFILRKSLVISWWWTNFDKLEEKFLQLLHVWIAQHLLCHGH